jgi:pimeloyl-ACP methyl ester carboxylesterase
MGFMSQPKARQIIADLGKIVNPDGIQENFKAMLGGVEQWIYTRGQDQDNPVLLCVHGGPASPMSPLMWMYQRPLEEYFTVVNWDQRGAGRTFQETDPASLRDTLRIEQYVNDTIELTQLLARRYHTQKVILLAHSWGTIIAVRAVLKRPDLFSAYVGIGQVVNTRDNERVSFEFALSEAKRHRNGQALSELESIAPYPGQIPLTVDRIMIARKWTGFYGGLSAYRTDSNYYFSGPLLSPEYDRSAVASLDRSGIFTLEQVLPELIDVDLKDLYAFPIPLFIFMGRHDYYTPSTVTADWFEKMDAPYKKAIWFENSAHLVPFEEPGRMLISLVQYVRPIARKAGVPAREPPEP